MNDILEGLLSYVSNYPGRIPKAELDRRWDEIQKGATKEAVLREIEKRFTEALKTLGPNLVSADETKEQKQQQAQQVELLALGKELRKEVDKLFLEYDLLCKIEYLSIKPEIQKEFQKSARARNQQPIEFYKRLRPYYYRAGFTAPKILNDIKSIKFLGSDLMVHVEMEKILKRAEQIVNDLPREVKLEVYSKVHTILGLQLRPIAGKETLSLHALGLAIDIDPGSNPQVIGKVAKAINDILDSMPSEMVPDKVSQGHLEDSNIKRDLSITSEERLLQAYEKLLSTSQDIQAFLEQKTNDLELLDDWEQTYLSKKDDPKLGNQPYALLGNLIVAFGGGNKESQIKNGIRKIKAVKENGLVTIPLELFNALNKSNATSGIEWHTQKDIMHFETTVPSTFKQSK